MVQSTKGSGSPASKFVADLLIGIDNCLILENHAKELQVKNE
jgi:hypothetical protein